MKNGRKILKKEQIISYAFARQFRKDKENLAKIATMEMGKAIKESRAEVEKCAWAMEYFADNGKSF